MYNEFTKGGIYVYENQIDKLVYVGQTKNFIRRYNEHKKSSHREDLFDFINHKDSEYKIIYTFDNLTDEDSNDLSIIEDMVLCNYIAYGYEVMNKKTIPMNYRKALSEKFYDTVYSRESIIIDDSTIKSIKLTISELRSYLINKAIKKSKQIKYHDIIKIQKIINKDKFLSKWWKKDLYKAETFNNINFETIFTDIGVTVLSSYCIYEKKYKYIIHSLDEMLFNFEDDYGFIVYILRNEEVTQYFKSIEFNVKSINIDWYVENRILNREIYMIGEYY